MITGAHASFVGGLYVRDKLHYDENLRNNLQRKVMQLSDNLHDLESKVIEFVESLPIVSGYERSLGSLIERLRKDYEFTDTVNRGEILFATPFRGIKPEDYIRSQLNSEYNLEIFEDIFRSYIRGKRVGVSDVRELFKNYPQLLSRKLLDTYAAAEKHFSEGNFAKGVLTLRFARENAFDIIAENWQKKWDWPQGLLHAEHLLVREGRYNIRVPIDWYFLGLDSLEKRVPFNPVDFSDISLCGPLPNLKGLQPSYTTVELLEEMKKQGVRVDTGCHYNRLIEAILEGFPKQFIEETPHGSG